MEELRKIEGGGLTMGKESGAKDTQNVGAYLILIMSHILQRPFSLLPHSYVRMYLCSNGKEQVYE